MRAGERAGRQRATSEQHVHQRCQVVNAINDECHAVLLSVAALAGGR
jgi:hypothetical protein